MRLVAALACAWALAATAVADTPDVLPHGSVAAVGSATISKARYEHWLAIGRRGTGDGEEKLRPEVMRFLIQGRWLEGEARRLRVRVTRRAVRRKLRREKRVQFDSEREYRRFLRRSGMTERDVLVRLRLELLQARLIKRVLRGVEGSRARARTIRRYTRRFRGRWRARTACATGYRVRECSRELPVAAP